VDVTSLLIMWISLASRVGPDFAQKIEKAAETTNSWVDLSPGRAIAYDLKL